MALHTVHPVESAAQATEVATAFLKRALGDVDSVKPSKTGYDAVACQWVVTIEIHRTGFTTGSRYECSVNKEGSVTAFKEISGLTSYKV